METKFAYQTDHNGYFVGTVYCQPSPLEPGVWLIPGGAVEAAPPEFNEATHKAKWVEGAWTVEEIVVEPAQEEAPIATEPVVEGEVPVTEDSPITVQATRKSKKA